MDAFHKRLWGMLAFMVLALAFNAWALLASQDRPPAVIWSERCPPVPGNTYAGN